MTAVAAPSAVVEPLPLEGERAPRGWPVIVLAAVIFSTLSLWAAFSSDGFLEADSCTHYQYALHALGEPHYLVNVWGRPFVTALYAVPAVLGGRIAVRVTSLCLALLIAWVTYLIARDQKYRWPALAFAFVLAQPLVYLHSFSELTELPFALLLAVAFLAYRRRQWLMMASFVALLPTARPEGFGFLGLAAAALLLHRRPWWLMVLPLPLLIWAYAGWRIYGQPVYTDPLSLKLPESLRWTMWLRHEWPYAEKSAYDSGYLLHFVALMPAAVGPLLWPATVAGMGWSVGACQGERSAEQARRHEGTQARGGGEAKRDESKSTSPSLPPRSLGASVPPCLRAFLSTPSSRTQFLIAAIPLMILGGHSLLYWLGRMASNGELRYMLVVAPFWGLLSAKGFEWAAGRLNLRWPMAWAAGLAVVPVLVNLHYPVLPLRLTRDGARARAVAEWYRGDGAVRTAYPRLLASNPEIAFFLGVSHTDRGQMREWRKDVVAAAPPGTLLVWDPIYGLRNADTARVVTIEEIQAAGWIERPQWAATINRIGQGDESRLFVSPVSIFGKRSDGAGEGRGSANEEPLG